MEKNVNKQSVYYIEFLQEQLSDVAQKERRNLLIVSAIGLAVAWAGFLPNSLDFVGISAKELDPKGFARILALVVIYFLLSFMAYVFMNLKGIKWSLITESNNVEYETLKEVKNNLNINKCKSPHFLNIILNNKIVIIKIIFDLIIPLIVGISALYYLSSWAPKTSENKIFTVLPSNAGKKDTRVLFFNNTGSTFIKTDDEGSLATFILPFKQEALCKKGVNIWEWEGVAIEKTHEKFLKYLSTNISECGEKNNLVEIEVRGFSSSSSINKSKLKECGYSSSLDVNLSIANARGDNAAEILADHKGKYLSVKNHKWNGDIVNMIAKRRFNDRLPDREFSNGRGILNRRVEIHLLNGGGCIISKPGNFEKY